MKRFVAALLIFAGSLIGGALAQSVGGGIIAVAQAAIAWTQNIVYAGVSDSSNSALWLKYDISGTASNPVGGFMSPDQIFIQNDTADASTGPGFLSGLLVTEGAKAGHRGGRVALDAHQYVYGTPAAAAGTQVYGAVNGTIFANSNLTGTGGACCSGWSGNLVGLDGQIAMQAGATFYAYVTGAELDVTVPNSTSTAVKHGLTIVLANGDTQRGVYDDSAITTGASDALTNTWLRGLDFGSTSHQWAYGADSTLIAASARIYPSPGSPTALYGIDFSQVAFAAGGAPMRTPLITPASSAAACAAGSIEWDANFIYICTATNTWRRATLASF